MTQPSIGFIGAGNMAASLIGGLAARGWPVEQLLAADPHTPALDALASRHGIRAYVSNEDVAARADVLVLAVKPQMMQEVVRALAATVRMRRPLVISIAAGIRVQSLADWLGDATLPIVRCMPNTPALVQLGASGLYASPGVSANQKALSETILGAVGITCWLEHEAGLDAVTALSGSGPAYFFLLMEAMIEAGTQLGLSEATSRQLTLQTALGAATMAMGSDVDPAELRRRVTSPGGTTERAIAHFEQAGLRSIVATALEAAARRSDELSQTLG